MAPQATTQRSMGEEGIECHVTKPLCAPLAPNSIDIMLKNTTLHNHSLNWLNPNRISLSTSEGPDHRCQQTRWGAFQGAFQHLSTQITGYILCSSQVQLGKEEETFHWTQCKGPWRTCSQQDLFTEGTANLFFHYGAQHFQGGNIQHDFPVPSRQGLYQTCMPVLHSNATCYSLSTAASRNLGIFFI